MDTMEFQIVYLWSRIGNLSRGKEFNHDSSKERTIGRSK